MSVHDLLKDIDHYTDAEEIHIYAKRQSNTLHIQYKLLYGNSTILLSSTVHIDTRLMVGSVKYYTRLRLIRVECSDCIVDARRLFDSTENRAIQITIGADSILC